MAWLVLFDFLGTIAFAISGAITAIRHRMDIFGVNILAVVTATGGGMLRDIIIGDFPPKAFRDPFYVLVSMATANAVFVFLYFRQGKRLEKGGNEKKLPVSISQVYEETLFWLDTLGLGAFTVDGVIIGINAGKTDGLFFITFLGVLTGVGGGVLRDLLAGETPAIFVKHIYALAAISGGLLTAILYRISAPHSVCMISGFLAVLLIRWLARHFRWNLPRIGRSAGRGRGYPSG
ncbi:MAG: trimeric intracellular cation channel family protein [Lachnospiraceae bacterium]|jgi:uncharacterized membrane protein YeiH